MLNGLFIAVLMGGPGSERVVSLRSAEGVAAALVAGGARVVTVDVRGPEFEVPAGVDVAFNCIHGTFGEDGQLQGILERRGIAYTGGRAASSARAFDKLISKKLFLEHEVPTPGQEVLVLSRGQKPKLSVPLVMKPPREGSSVGVHIIRDAAAIPAALEDLRQFGDEVLVEKFIAGKELTVGILGGEALPVVHIRPCDGFYDMNNKYPWMGGGGGSEYICPADISASATQKTQAAALRAHRALGVEVYSRVDIMLDEWDNPWVLEVNTIPGMTETSLLPKAAAAVGIDYPTLCARIVQLSLAIPP
ncbi:MAG: D-alanine--D-alanine ligase [Verrucomicrobiales bacterium]